MNDKTTLPVKFEWNEKLWDEFEKKVYQYCNNQTPLKVIQELMVDFKKSKQPDTKEKERIEVRSFNQYSDDSQNYHFYTTRHIPTERHEAIKQAIESCLNEPLPQPSSAPPIVKDKEVLFTTEDGFDVVTYQNLFVVELPSYSISNIVKLDGIKHDGSLYFSTKEAAEQYILENKPCLSLNDLLGVWDTSGLNEGRYYGNSPLYKNFLQKVKEKLKQ